MDLLIAPHCQRFVDEILRHSVQGYGVYDHLEFVHTQALVRPLDDHRPVSCEVPRDVGGGRFDFWGARAGDALPLYGEVKRSWVTPANTFHIGATASVAEWVDDIEKLTAASDPTIPVHCVFVLSVFGAGTPPAPLAAWLAGLHVAGGPLNPLTAAQVRAWTGGRGAWAAAGPAASDTLAAFLLGAQAAGVAVSALCAPMPLLVPNTHMGQNVPPGPAWFSPFCLEWVRNI